MEHESRELAGETIAHLRTLAHDLSNAIENVMQGSYLLAQSKLDDQSQRWLKLIDQAAQEAARNQPRNPRDSPFSRLISQQVRFGRPAFFAVRVLGRKHNFSPTCAGSGISTYHREAQTKVQTQNTSCRRRERGPLPGSISFFVGCAEVFDGLY